MPLGRRSGYDISTQTHPRTFECVSGPSVKERPNPKDRMEPEPDHSGQGLPSSIYLPSRRNAKLATYMSPIPEPMSWKVDSLVQSWKNLYAYAYPPTSLIRACLNQIRTEDVEVILIAPCWPNQEWFPELLDLTIDFPLILPPSQRLLKQTFSHHFHQNPKNLNLHAWRLSRDFTRREGFLKRLPKGSLYFREPLLRGYMNISGRFLENGADLSNLILARQVSLG